MVANASCGNCTHCTRSNGAPAQFTRLELYPIHQGHTDNCIVIWISLESQPDVYIALVLINHTYTGTQITQSSDNDTLTP